MPEMSFGRSIRYRRNKLGLSQTRLGELVGRSASTVRSWEKDSTTPTDPEVLRALSAVLGIEHELLFDRAGVEVPEIETSPTMEQELGSLAPQAAGTAGETDSLEEKTEGQVEAAADEPLHEDEVAADQPDDVDEESDPEPSGPTWSARGSEREPVAVGVTATVGPGVEGGVAASQMASPQPGFVAPQQPYVYTMPAPPVAEPTYMEDESQRQLYRVRNLATLVLAVALIVTFLWALGNGWQELTSWWDEFVGQLQL